MTPSREAVDGARAAEPRSTRWSAVRVVHPFPSVLDGLATVAIGLAAGGTLDAAARLGVAMVLLQFAIGASNDVLDAPFDTGRTDKPLAVGTVSVRTVAAVAVACAVAGLGLAAASGPQVLAIASAGLGVGLAYDLRLKRTPWAWVALAAALPLLVVFAWYGATGRLDPALGALLLPAVLAGASLALGNALVDPDRDRVAGLVTPAVAFGARAAWRAAVALQAAALAVAAASAAWLGAGPPFAVAALGAGGVAFGGLALLRDEGAPRRERGWELQAVGLAVVGAAWVAAAAVHG